MRAGLAARGRGENDVAELALTRAVALYRGDFLSDEPYAEWAFAERDHLRDLAGQALRGLVDIKLAVGDLEAATEQMHRLAELEPLDLDVQRELLALLLRRNRHAEVHRRHEIVKRRWRRAFGEDPPFELADLGATASES
jgi:DNA-binding SARP family transcriptional activator